MWGSGGTAPVIIKLGTTWKLSVQLHAPYRFTHRQPPNKRLAGPQGRSGRFGQEKETIPPIPRMEPRILCRSACSLTNIRTELSVLLNYIRELRNLRPLPVIFHKIKAYYDMWKGGQADLLEEPGAGGKILLKWAIKSRM